MIRCVIVDDEPPARSLLRALIAEHTDIEVIAEFGEGLSAVTGIRELKPDLVFLDVQMPELDGFGVIEALDGDLPTTIFVTAFDEYALRAFDTNAIDYVLKPYDQERLDRAIERARQRIPAAPGREDRTRLFALIDELRHQSRRYERLVIREGDRTFLQRVEDIDWIEADGKYVRIHVGTRAHVMRETLARLEERLDPTRFVRVSRSIIVNLDRVSEIRPWFKGDMMLLMQSGAKITTTRNYRSALARLLEEEN